MQFKKVIIGLSLMVWGWQLSSFDSRAKVIVCDVGQGSGVIVQEGRQQLLYDVGPDNKMMAKCLEKYLPKDDKEIEGVMISHWDTDHSGGLSEIEKYYKIDRLWAATAKNGAEILKQNDRVEMSSIQLDIVLPAEITGDDNRDSMVIKITRGNFKMLLMGDVTAEEEGRIVWRKEMVETVPLLMVAHHGSGAATSQVLLDQIKPTTAIISVGKNNRFGHPNSEVIKRLEKAGIDIKRTDELGDIVREMEW